MPKGMRKSQSVRFLSGSGPFFFCLPFFRDGGRFFLKFSNGVISSLEKIEAVV